MRELGGRLAAFLLAIGLYGCLVDAGAPCGETLVVGANGTCVCPDGLAPSGGGCVPVVHETDDDGAGAMSPACETGADCACTSSRDCGEGDLCDRYASERCVAAPAGLGVSCSNASDCAGTEATFCESFSSRTCQVQGCAERAGACPGDMVCCAYAVLGTSLCVPSDAAADGGCPAPGLLVMRSGTP